MSTVDPFLLFEFSTLLPDGGVGDWKELHATLDEAKATAPGDAHTTQMVVEMTNQSGVLIPVPLATRHGDGDWLDGDHYDAFAEARDRA